MRVLVTGGAGFIGSHFAKRLQAAGDDVRVLDKLTYSGNPANLEGTGIELVAADICDAEAVGEAAAGCDAIVNFAAETHVDRSILGPAEFIQTNVAGVQVLLDHARAAGIRLVHVSTDEVYGDVDAGVSSVEDDPLRPSSPYSAAKAGGDLQVLGSVRTYGVDALITRGSNTYGPFQYPEKLLPLFLTNALDGDPLPMYGDGNQVRDWLYVEDHCAGIEAALRKGRAGEAYNIGGGEEATNREITGLVLEHTGADASLVRRVEDRAGHDRRYSLDTTKARAELGLGSRDRTRPGLPTHCHVVQHQPRLVGADQELGRLPRVLRAPVRGAPRRLLALAAPLGFLSQLADLLSLALNLLGAVEKVDDAVALSERAAGVREVVARVRLDELAAARKPCDRLLQQRQRLLVAPGLHQLEALVVELGRACRGRGGRGRGRRRARGGRDGLDDRRARKRDGLLHGLLDGLLRRYAAPSCRPFRRRPGRGALRRGRPRRERRRGAAGAAACVFGCVPAGPGRSQRRVSFRPRGREHRAVRRRSR